MVYLCYRYPQIYLGQDGDLDTAIAICRNDSEQRHHKRYPDFFESSTGHWFSDGDSDEDYAVFKIATDVAETLQEL